jgi:Tfp pilus assembly protein PilN
MINLLSPDDKHQLSAARQNVILLRYNIIALVSILTIAIIYGGSFFITMRSKSVAEEQLKADNTRTMSYADVRSKIQQFSKNLTTAKTILSSEIIYSELITDIAKTLPSGTVLTNLTIQPDSFGKAMSLSAAAKNYGKALELKTVLENSPLFSNVSLESVGSVGADAPSSAGYPINVILKTTFATAEEIQALKKEEATP